MRNGFDGLCGVVRNELGKDPLSGEVFIFMNKRRNQVKVLLWEGDGFSMYYNISALRKAPTNFPHAMKIPGVLN